MKNLNEITITVPYKENPTMAFKTLSSYYESLIALVNKNEENYSKNVQREIDLNLPITEIIKMEQDNLYQNLFTEVNNSSLLYNDAREGSITIIFIQGFPLD